MSRGFVFDRLVLLIISMLLPIVLTPLAGVTGRGAVRALRVMERILIQKLGEFLEGIQGLGSGIKDLYEITKFLEWHLLTPTDLVNWVIRRCVALRHRSIYQWNQMLSRNNAGIYGSKLIKQLKTNLDYQNCHIPNTGT